MEFQNWFAFIVRCRAALMEELMDSRHLVSNENCLFIASDSFKNSEDDVENNIIKHLGGNPVILEAMEMEDLASEFQGASKNLKDKMIKRLNEWKSEYDSHMKDPRKGMFLQESEKNNGQNWKLRTTMW